MQANEKVLRENYEALLRSLDAEALSDHLFAKGVITLQLYEKLSLIHITRTQKNKTLLQDLLRNASPDLIPQLCEVLDAEDATRYLADQLKGCITITDNIVYSISLLKSCRVLQKII